MAAGGQAHHDPTAIGNTHSNGYLSRVWAACINTADNNFNDCISDIDAQ